MKQIMLINAIDSEQLRIAFVADKMLEGFHIDTTSGALLEGNIYKAMLSLFDMRWSGVEKELAKEEQIEFRRLCKSESPDFILNHPDYYAFFTYSMFWGIVQ